MGAGIRWRSALARDREVHSTEQRLKKCIRQQAGSYGCVQSAGLVFTGPRVGARLPANGEVHSAQQRLKKCIRQQAGYYGCVLGAGFNIHGATCRSALARDRGSPFITVAPEEMHSPASRLLRMCAGREIWYLRGHVQERACPRSGKSIQHSNA